jgi:DNA-binding NtrC family response regulator
MTPSSPPAQVLYVEDDDDLRSVLCLLLSSDGFNVTAVSSAEEALKQLSKHTFAAMLTDYSLPPRNAAWLLAQAKTRGLLDETAVVVFSGEQRPSGIDGYRYLRKPADIETVSSLLRTVLAERAKSAPRTSFARIALAACTGHSRKLIRSVASHISSFEERMSALTLNQYACA